MSFWQFGHGLRRRPLITAFAHFCNSGLTLQRKLSSDTLSGRHGEPTRQDGRIIVITDYTTIVLFHPDQTHFSQEAAHGRLGPWKQLCPLWPEQERPRGQQPLSWTLCCSYKELEVGVCPFPSISDILVALTWEEPAPRATASLPSVSLSYFLFPVSPCSALPSMEEHCRWLSRRELPWLGEGPDAKVRCVTKQPLRYSFCPGQEQAGPQVNQRNTGAMRTEHRPTITTPSRTISKAEQRPPMVFSPKNDVKYCSGSEEGGIARGYFKD